MDNEQNKKYLLLNQLFLSLKLPEIKNKESLNLFLTAITHKSFLSEEELNKAGSLALHYDRLEFLGDAILKTVLSEYIFHKYPNYDSGSLTKLNAYLLSGKTLSKIAKKFNFQNFILCKKLKQSDSVLEDVLESFLAACYLTYNFEFTKKFIINLYGEEIEKANLSNLKGNYKAALQEYTQSYQMGLPEYEVASQSGPSHDPVFTIKIKIKGAYIAEASASSKKEAGQLAAKEALKKIKEK